MLSDEAAFGDATLEYGPPGADLQVKTVQLLAHLAQLLMLLFTAKQELVPVPEMSFSRSLQAYSRGDSVHA